MTVLTTPAVLHRPGATPSMTAVVGRGGFVAFRMAAVFVGIGAGFVLFQQPFRELEARAAVALLHALGVDGVFDASAAAIGIVPARGPVFQAIVTPTCSSLSSILAIVCLGSCTPRGRRALPLTAAVATVMAGNLIRIALSVGAGAVAGRSGLILFHDGVGSLFAFGFTLGGYVLMLYLALPADGERPAPVAAGPR